MRRLWASWILVGLACAPTTTTTTSTVQPPSVAPPELEPDHSQPESAPDLRGRFAGVEVGVEYVHGASPTVGALTLPPGLERQSMIRFADGWVYLVAKDGPDLVLLLVDEAGVVSDDVTLVGLSEHLAIVDCEADNTLGVIAPKDCESASSVESERAWTHEGPRLVDVGEPVTCWCDLVELACRPS